MRSGFTDTPTNVNVNIYKHDTAGCS